MRCLLLLLCASLSAADSCRLKAERVNGSTIITIHGTATPVGKCLAVTAAHNLFDDDKREEIRTCLLEIDGEWRKAELVKADRDLDLALIRCKAIESAPEFADQPDEPGAEVSLHGSKQGAQMTQHTGKIVKPHYKGTCRTLAKVAFDHGDSGGGVFRAGKLAGIVVCSDRKGADLDKEHGQYVPVTVVREFLKAEVATK